MASRSDMTQASLTPRNVAPECQDPDSEVAGARVPGNPAGVRILSTPRSGPLGMEQVDLRTPANVPDPESKFDKLEALEKNVKELEREMEELVRELENADMLVREKNRELQEFKIQVGG